MTHLLYRPDLEIIADDETETFTRIAETFQEMGRTVAAQEGRAVRVSHAKATALLAGELEIDDGLPTELAQGIAALPRSFEAIVRFAQGPGENLHDRVSTHRGMAVKLLDVPGERIPQAGHEPSQDFVLEGSGKAFINSNAETFLSNLRAGVSHAPSLSEGVKSAVSATARGTEAALETVGLESKTLAFFGHPSRHPLAEPYFSQAPLRWGDHVCKLGFFPSERTLAALDRVEIDAGDDHDAFRTAMVEHFAAQGAEFELRVQLAIDPKITPIEDAAREWPEDATPYRRVALLTLPPQRAWSKARDDYAAGLSFRPAHSLAAHRPLGQVMRARLFVYERLVAFRQADAGTPGVNPVSVAELP